MRSTALLKSTLNHFVINMKNYSTVESNSAKKALLDKVYSLDSKILNNAISDGQEICRRTASHHERNPF